MLAHHSFPEKFRIVLVDLGNVARVIGDCEGNAHEKLNDAGIIDVKLFHLVVIKAGAKCPAVTNIPMGDGNVRVI